MSQLRTDEDAVVHASTDVDATAELAHVLVAGGDDVSRRRRQVQLEAAGFRVSTARTGFEAIVKATCQLPDLILIDKSIQDIEAAETSRLITTCPVTSHIPVVQVAPGRLVPARIFARLRPAG